MLGYATVGTNNLVKAMAFYDSIVGVLGGRRILEFERGVYYGDRSMELGVLSPFDGQPATSGNGNMVSMVAVDRACVDKVHALALVSGGANEGSPGLRGDPSIQFYAAYFRDPDGNKLCVFHVGPE